MYDVAYDTRRRRTIYSRTCDDRGTAHACFRRRIFTPLVVVGLRYDIIIIVSCRNYATRAMIFYTTTADSKAIL